MHSQSASASMASAIRMPSPCTSPGQRGEQHPRVRAAPAQSLGERTHQRAQRDLQGFTEQVLVIDLQRACRPCIAHSRRQRRGYIENEAREPFARGALEQLEAEIVVSAYAQQFNEPVEFRVRRVLSHA